MKAKQVWIDQAGGPEVLTVREVELAEPGADEVCVRVLAAGILHADLLQRQGKRHPGSPAIPFPLGSEVAGVIEKVGRDITELAVGQRIVAVVHAGGYSDFICLAAWRCLVLPGNVPPEKAAAAVVNYWTAYYLLHRAMTLQRGQRILIHAASGAVGTALSQLGRLMALEMFGTASKHKHDVLRQHGVVAIDYRQESVGERMAALAPEGVDAVFDPVGGRSWIESYQMLRDNGRLAIFGAMVLDKRPLLTILPTALQLLLLALWPDGKSVRFVGLSPDRYRESYREDGQKVLDLLAEGAIDPIIAATFPLTQAAAAHRFLESGQGVGKVLLQPD